MMKTFITFNDYIVYRKILISTLIVLGYRYVFGLEAIRSNLFVHSQIIMVKMRNILNNI